MTNPGSRTARTILSDMATRAVSRPLAQVPNALTILRLGLIPVFVVLIIGADEGYSWPAALVFAAAGITDQVDGFLARRWHVESRVREGGRPARRPADDRRRGAPALAGGPSAARRARGHPRPGRSAPRWVQARRAARLRLRGEPAGQARDLGSLRVARVHDGDARGDATGRSGSSGRGSASRCSRPRSTCSRHGARCAHEGGRHGRRGGDAPPSAHVEPAEADGADRRQAVHGAHHRAPAGARLRGRDHHRRVPAAGDPLVLRRRRVARGEHLVLGRGDAARHGRLGPARDAAARRADPRHLGRRALRRRPRRDARGAPRAAAPP